MRFWAKRGPERGGWLSRHFTATRAILAIATIGTVIVGSAAASSGAPLIVYSNHGIYVALGDSYSSGEGNPPYLPGTDVEADNCHRSALSWSFRVNLDQAFYAKRFSFHACSGAVVADMTNYNGKNHEPAQLSWVKNHQPIALITLTIGGNDARFADVMAYCAFWDVLSKDITCQSGWQYRVNQAIASLASTTSGDSLTRLYKKIIADAGPGANIRVVGYPRFFPVNPPRICGTGVIENYFVQSDMLWMNSEVAKMDGVIKTAVAAVSATAAANQDSIKYVPAYNAFNGHELCTKSPDLNHAIVSRHKGIRAGSFHPNLNGQNALADMVDASL